MAIIGTKMAGFFIFSGNYRNKDGRFVIFSGNYSNTSDKVF